MTPGGAQKPRYSKELAPPCDKAQPSGVSCWSVIGCGLPTGKGTSRSRWFPLGPGPFSKRWQPPPLMGSRRWAHQHATEDLNMTPTYLLYWSCCTQFLKFLFFFLPFSGTLPQSLLQKTSHSQSSGVQNRNDHFLCS